MRITIGEFKETGINQIDVDLVCKKWNHLCWIAQYGEQFRLIKNVRYDSPITSTKLIISECQANELIVRLGLTGRQDTNFRRAYDWRKDSDREVLNQKRMSKNYL